MTNLTGPPSVRASVKLVAEVNPEDLYWQAAIITDKEVALEDYGGDNTTQFTNIFCSRNPCVYVLSPIIWRGLPVIGNTQCLSTVYVGEVTEKQCEHAVHKFWYMNVHN